MSHELWRERKAVPCRLPSCGHVIQISRRNVVEVQCTVCGDGPPLQRRPSRDYVPSETLTWPWAECTKTNHLRLVGQTKVCGFILSLFLFCTCFSCSVSVSCIFVHLALNPA